MSVVGGFIGFVQYRQRLTTFYRCLTLKIGMASEADMSIFCVYSTNTETDLVSSLRTTHRTVWTSGWFITLQFSILRTHTLFPFLRYIPKFGWRKNHITLRIRPIHFNEHFASNTWRPLQQRTGKHWQTIGDWSFSCKERYLKHSKTCPLVTSEQYSNIAYIYLVYLNNI